MSCQLGQLAERCFRAKLWEECVFWCDENLTLLENSAVEDTKERVHKLLLIKADTVRRLIHVCHCPTSEPRVMNFPLLNCSCSTPVVFKNRWIVWHGPARRVVDKHYVYYAK